MKPTEASKVEARPNLRANSDEFFSEISPLQKTMPPVKENMCEKGSVESARRLG